MISALAAVALSLIVQEPKSYDARSYEACIKLTEAEPEAARDYANAWQTEGGGDSARHCAAVAMMALDAPASAGAMLADLGLRTRAASPSGAAQYYLQAAEAFAMANRADDAFRALRDVYTLMPDDPAVHMAAAGVYTRMEQWEGVVLTISALSKHATLSADAYALRARAHINMADMEKAAADTAAALALEPYLINALVLRGELLSQGRTLPIVQLEDQPAPSE